MSPYNLLNRALRAEKNVVKEIVKVRDVLYLVMAITSGGWMQGPSSQFNPQKASSLSSGEVVTGDCLYCLLEVGRESKGKRLR